MIDLHLHTTASDGRLSPDRLVARAAAAGLTKIAVTDHDTTAAIDEVSRHADGAGLGVVPGIELTAVDGGRDVHVLGYFFDAAHAPFVSLLAWQREQRVARTREIGRRLAGAGVAIDVEAVLSSVVPTSARAVGRPLLARAMVVAGAVATVQEAFDRYLGEGRPAYVPREGRSPALIVEAIHDAGGVASLAHPGVTGRDELITPLVDAGLDALEAFHTDHSPAEQARYLDMASALGVLVTGGSDFHGDGNRATLGVVGLPAEAFAALEGRAGRRLS